MVVMTPDKEKKIKGRMGRTTAAHLRSFLKVLLTSLLCFVLLCPITPSFAQNTDESKPGSESGSEDLWGLSIDIKCTLANNNGIQAGQDNILKLNLENQGGLGLSKSEIRLNLPDEIKLYSGAASQDAGYFSVGSSKWAEFHLTADKKTKSKSYPVQVEVSGTDQSGSTRTVSRTFYLPVLGADSGADFSMSDIVVRSVSLPQEAESGQDFTLSFQVANTGAKAAQNLKITVETAEGLLNRSPSTFMERRLEAGESKSYKVALFTLADAAEKNYSVKITAEPTTPADDDKENGPVSQYTGVLIRPSDKSTVKTPRLMVQNYSYGGSFVQAGANFPLKLDLYNTSGKELRNIQVTVTAADGVFVPVKAGNTLYVDKLAPNGTVELSLSMNVKNDTPQKSVPVDVDMAYEDLKETEYTAKSTISVPVNQETRLVVEDVVAPPELYAGNQSAVSVNFYNMGKSLLNNLRVNVEGDFDQPQSNTYYVGNMDPGKSDSYDFTFVPKAAGPMKGTITFAYEDGSGVEKHLQREFSFNVMDMPAMDDPGMMAPPEDATKKPIWLYGVVGAAALAVVIGLILRKKHLKKKRDMDLELED